MSKKRDEFEYDVFISYSHRDSDWVWNWLVPRLRKRRLRVCIDEEAFLPGEPILIAMQRAVQRSRKTLLVFTPDYIASQWTEFENLLVQTIDLVAGERRLIPLLLNKCDIPPRIRMLIYLDFTNPEKQESQLNRLVAAIRSKTMPKLPSPTLAEHLAEEAMTRSQTLEETRAFIAHELKNAIAPIQTLAKMLHDASADSTFNREEVRSFSERILRQSAIAFELLNEYMNYAKPLKFSPSKVDLNKFIQSILTEWHSTFQERGITVSAQWSTLPLVEIDKHLMQEVVNNVFQNAIEAMEQGGRLELKTFQDFNMAVVIFRDSGCGIKKEYLPRLFELGFTTKLGKHGAGLGLAFAHRVITDVHQGHISIRNNEDGPGVTVRIEIPIREESESYDRENGSSSHR